MEANQRRGKLFRLTIYLYALLLLCLASLLANHWHTSDTGHQRLSIVANFLDESLASVKNRKRNDGNHSQSSTSRIRHIPGKFEHVTDDIIIKREKMSFVAGLNCDRHGGPSEDIAKEMIYWEDIPSDSQHVSPFKKQGVTQYLTFEPDSAGWNNVRMALETVVALAIAMGRTLVLPPEQEFHMLTNFTGKDGKNQRSSFSFSHFFPMDYVGWEHLGLDVITMQEFLEREYLTGNIRDLNGNVSFPPYNITDWDGVWLVNLVNEWLRNITLEPQWNPFFCMAVFPASNNASDIKTLEDIRTNIEKTGGFPSFRDYVGRPQPVDAPTEDRLKEISADRGELCIYDEEMQNARVIHFRHDEGGDGARLLVHFYAFLFFQDWQHDLWMKRFVRDHIRYIDKIQCAAARVVFAVRQRVRARADGGGDYYSDGNFDSLHIRRGDFADFQNETRIDADQIYNVVRQKVAENSTIYIATDETDRDFFDPLRQHYDLVYLSDFHDVLLGVNTNYYGMIDQLVAARSRVFFGCFWSTFSGYINRLRGYHANRAKAPGYEDGIIDSWYYVPDDRRDVMQTFYPLYGDYFEREFPTSWRLIDTGVEQSTTLRLKK